MYPDEEVLLRDFLTGAVTPTPRIGVSTPADPQGTYAWVANGFVKLQRIGGAGRYGIDRPRVYVECFALTYDGAKSLAGKVRDALENRLVDYRGADGVAGDALTDSAPAWAPYDDTKLTRFIATYSLTTHGA